MERPDGASLLYIGVDVGGTNIKTGVVDDDGQSRSLVTLPTRAARGWKAGLADIEDSIHQAILEAGTRLEEITAIGLATPGTMDIPAGRLLDPPNLPGWQDIPIRDMLGERLKRPTILQNDANAAAYGEYWAGAGRQAYSLVFWTLGTGVGCGIIIGETIIEGEHSHGAECGHIIVEMDGGQLCGTGQYGTLEAYAGTHALLRDCREALDTERESVLSGWLEAGEELTPLLIAKAAEAGDGLADDLVMQLARYMGIGTTSLIHTIDPGMILFGGAMTFGRNESPLGRRFLERVRDEVNQRAFPVPSQNVRIDYASLGGNAGFIGAAGCARLKFGPPV